MARFFCFMNGSRSGGEGQANVRSTSSSIAADPLDVPMELLQKQHPEFHRNRPDHPRHFAEPGTRLRVHGDEAQVLHEERNQDGSVDLYVQRSVKGNSGTYAVKAVPDENRKLTVSKLKRTFE